MSSRQQRREANAAGRLYTVKTGVNQFFTNQDLLGQVQQAVQLVTPILVESSLLANLHILRCLEDREVVPELHQMFFNRCFYAVTSATGSSRQFKEASDASLAKSYNTLYRQNLPDGHQKPERPGFLKDVSTALLLSRLNLVNACHRLQDCAINPCTT